MAWIRYTLLALLPVFSPVIANDLPRLSDCEKPVYSLDQYESDQELMLELDIKAYKECLLHVVDSHNQSDAGRPRERMTAARKLEQIDLDQQAVWPQTEVIHVAQSTGLWTQNRSAAAVSISDDWGTGVYVVLNRENDAPLVVNITRIGSALFIKLGLADRTEYESYEIQPVEWLEETNARFILSVRLRAWRDGQRYTVSAPVVVNADGSVIWQ